MASRGLIIDVDNSVVIVGGVVCAVATLVVQLLFNTTDYQRQPPSPRSNEKNIKNTSASPSSPSSISSPLIQGVAATVAVFTGMLYLFHSASTDLTARRAHNPEYPRATDLIISLYSFAIFGISRLLLTPLFERLANRLIPNDGDDTKRKEEREQKVERFASQLWKTIYHTLATVGPLYILHGQKWWPPGHGTPETIFDNYPHTPQVPLLREFYLLELGYYLSALVFTLQMPKRKSFFTMVLHHAFTIALVACSYLIQNTMRLGVSVMVLHDASDVFVCLTRLVLDLSWVIPTIVFYVLLLSSWMWLRLWVYPVHILKAVTYDLYNTWMPWSEMHGWVPLAIFLFALQAMHILWFFELLSMAINFCKTGKRQDTTEEK